MKSVIVKSMYGCDFVVDGGASLEMDKNVNSEVDVKSEIDKEVNLNMNKDVS